MLRVQTLAVLLVCSIPLGSLLGVGFAQLLVVLHEPVHILSFAGQVLVVVTPADLAICRFAFVLR